MNAEEVVAPLDAYVTCKPDEPPFTLQGGDPLAAPLVRLWVELARIRAGARNDIPTSSIEKLVATAAMHSIADDERERDNLLVRATAAEEVSWSMDAYREHGHATEKPTEAQDTHLTELQRIDLHDLKIRVAQKLSNFRCELIEMREALAAAGYQEVAVYVALKDAEQRLLYINEAIEPRRLFKKDK